MTEPLVDGGQFAPQSGGSGAGTIYINAKWQFNANALYQAPCGIELSANVFGRQGYPFPIVRTGTAAALGADSGTDGPPQPARSIRSGYPNLWNTDFRVAQAFRPGGMSNIRLMLDVFNVFNANTALVRVNDVTVDELQRAGAEPEPAHRAGRPRGGILTTGGFARRTPHRRRSRGPHAPLRSGGRALGALSFSRCVARLPAMRPSIAAG